ncbi:hypothetical protein U1Q18_044623, partial [Sarracenia purpurea var. burkii]
NKAQGKGKGALFFPSAQTRGESSRVILKPSHRRSMPPSLASSLRLSPVHHCAILRRTIAHHCTDAPSTSVSIYNNHRHW